MARIVNRVNEDILRWNEHEEQLLKIFPERITNSKELLRDALSFYKAVKEDYKNTTDLAEQRSLLALSAQIRELEKKLYPTVIHKVFRSTQELVTRERRKETAEVAVFRSEQRIKDHMIKRGFGSLDIDLAPYLRKGDNEFTVPITWTVNGDKKINFDLQFTRDSSGEYDVSKYIAALPNAADPSHAVKQTFDISDKFTPTQAYNLLCGRAVQKEYISPGGEFYRAWRQLDFNDKDPGGNHKVVSIIHDKKFDVAGEVNKLIDAGLILAPSSNTIIDGIKNGNDQYTICNAKGEDKIVYIKADAKNNVFQFSDEKREPITLASLLGKEPAHSIVKDKEQEQSLDKRQGLRM